MFIEWWNDYLPKDIDSMIMYSHGSPRNLNISTTEVSRINADRVSELVPKNISMLILMGCNSGHLDVEDNIAKAFVGVVGAGGKVIAVDGRLGYAPSPIHTVVSGESFVNYLPEDSTRKPAGMVAYSKSFTRRNRPVIRVQSNGEVKGPMTAGSFIKAVYEAYVKWP